ncbi:MAG: alpha/beta hydrolase [Lachnospiraceae bacterium]|nr:alpha/beta hydrolase [Lachnospiraceae bacterium]
MSNIVEKELSFFRNGMKIYAKEFISADRAVTEGLSMPAMVLSHGFGSSAREMEYYAGAFAGMGYAAYCFDFCGGSAGGSGRSEGTPSEMTIGTECEDLIAVIEGIKEFPYVDGSRISLMGCSQGGFVSALTAARLGSAVENLILLYPALCIPDHARLGILGGARYDVRCVPEFIACPNQMNLPRRFHEEMQAMDPYLEISKYKGRVLLIHGMRDEVVNYAYAVKAKESYEKGQCSLMLIRDAGHGFNEQQNESAVIEMEHFLQQESELQV